MTTTNTSHRDSHLQVNAMYEIVGKVIDLAGGHGLGVRVLSSTEWPKNANGQLPDTKLFEAVVDATHRYKGIFYEGEGETNGDDGGH
jgi:Replication factor A protein 3